MLRPGLPAPSVHKGHKGADWARAPRVKGELSGRDSNEEAARVQECSHLPVIRQLIRIRLRSMSMIATASFYQGKGFTCRCYFNGRRWRPRIIRIKATAVFSKLIGFFARRKPCSGKAKPATPRETGEVAIERGRQLTRPYSLTTRRLRTSSLYRSIWPASPSQLREINFSARTSASLCADFTKRRHSAD
jgi:hypothetical protein